MSSTSKAKHTPGPWVVTRGGQSEPFSVEASTRTVALVKTCRDETDANARLIAASPDMDLLLEAFRTGVIEVYKPTGEFRFNGLMYSTFRADWSTLVAGMGRDTLAAAIAKAEGK